MNKRKTLRSLLKAYAEGTPLSMITAYDATFARLFDQEGVDMLLVGDSLGNVIQGEDTTVPVELDDIVYHSRAVARGTQQAFIVADMPFGTYGANIDEAVMNAAKLMKAGHAHAVKLEGGAEFGELVSRISAIGIPVMGHLGLTPQSVHKLGGFFVQGRGEAAQKLIDDALALEKAGAFAIVLEMVPAELAAQVTERLSIPTIGIGAGNQTSGQVLVCYDFLGMNEGFSPKFLKRYANLAQDIRNATRSYIDEVQSREFPTDAHSFKS